MIFNTALLSILMVGSLHAEAVTCTGTNIDTNFRFGLGASSASSFLDASGNFYVAGSAYKPTNGQAISHWVTRQSKDGGHTWKLVDDFMYETNVSGEDIFPALCSDPSGNIYAAAYGYSSKSGQRWIVRQSKDAGATWNSIDDFQLQPSKRSKATGVCSDANGHLYVAGYASGKNGNYYGVVRKSSDAGATWTTADTFVNAEFNGITTDAQGNVYAVGYAFPQGGGSIHFCVRKSGDGGATWATVDYYQLNGQYSSGSGITADANGNIYAVGVANNCGVVRKSSDQGATWTTVDQTQAAAYRSITTDSNGTLYVCGNSTDSQGQYWLTKRSADQGATWETVDSYQIKKGAKVMIAKSIGTDSEGNVITAGNANGWLVRKLSCQ